MKHAGVHGLVRRTHEERVLGVLREHGVLSRGEIADLVGLSRTSISEITGNLLARGIDAVFADRFGAQVIVDNNTRFAALAEAISTNGATVQDLLM